MASLSSVTSSLVSSESLRSGGILERLQKNKDDHHTTVGPRQNLPLRKSDSTADILAKIYNFMVKKGDDEKLRYELYNDFQQEREEEEQKRHEKLIKLINGRAKAQTPDKKQKGLLSGLMSVFENIAKGVGSILGFLKDGVLSVMIGGIGKIVSAITSFKTMGMITKLTRLTSSLIGLMGVLVGGAGSFLFKSTATITKIVATVLAESSSFLWKILSPKIWDLMSKVVSGVLDVLGVKDAKKLAGRVLRGSTVLGALGIGAEVASSIYDKSREFQYGKDVTDLESRLQSLKDRYTQLKEDKSLTYKSSTKERMSYEILKEMTETEMKLKDARKKRYEEMIPIMKEQGYEPEVKRDVAVPRDALEQFKEALFGSGPMAAKIPGIASVIKEKQDQYGFTNTKTGEFLSFYASEGIQPQGLDEQFEFNRILIGNELSSKGQELKEDYVKYIQEKTKNMKESVSDFDQKTFESLQGSSEELKKMMGDVNSEDLKNSLQEMSVMVQKMLSSLNNQQSNTTEFVGPPSPDRVKSTVERIEEKQSLIDEKLKGLDLHGYSMEDLDKFRKQIGQTPFSKSMEPVTQQSIDNAIELSGNSKIKSLDTNVQSKFTVPTLMDETNTVAALNTPIINNSVNTIGGKSKFEDRTPIDSRHRNSSLNNALYRSTVAV